MTIMRLKSMSAWNDWFMFFNSDLCYLQKNELSKMQSKWDVYWRNTRSLEDTSPYAKWLRCQRLQILSKILSNVPRDFSVLDVGCGSGESLLFMRKLGFLNSIGIDFSTESIKLCIKNGLVEGKDVYRMDAEHTNFADKSFDIVHEEGVWEHFSDCRNIIRENARICNVAIFALQPNHFSPIGAALKFGGLLFRKSMREYSYFLSYYTKILDGLGFELLTTKYTLFREQAWLIYGRREDE